MKNLHSFIGFAKKEKWFQSTQRTDHKLIWTRPSHWVKIDSQLIDCKKKKRFKVDTELLFLHCCLKKKSFHQHELTCKHDDNVTAEDKIISWKFFVCTKSVYNNCVLELYVQKKRIPVMIRSLFLCIRIESLDSHIIQLFNGMKFLSAVNKTNIRERSFLNLRY